MLEVKNLCVSAGAMKIDSITISIPEGGCHVLLGATGNGKTVLLETIAGIRSAESGQIIAGDRDITGLPANLRHIGYVPQNLSLFPHLSVKENIYFSWRFKKNISDAYKEEMADICGMLEIDKLLDRSIGNLSGGERQRVALARALANDHKILLLDEPFTALHQMLKIELWSMIKDLKKKYGLTILLVTHDLDECDFLADTISVIHEGRILQTGTKDTVMKRPRNRIAADLLGYFASLCRMSSMFLNACSNNLPRLIKNPDCVTLGIVVSPPARSANSPLVHRIDCPVGCT